MILQGTVQGGRRKGRQKKRWEDNITELTGLKLGEALRKAENREGWRKVVAQSSLVPYYRHVVISKPTTFYLPRKTVMLLRQEVIYDESRSVAGSFESVQWNVCVHRLDLGLSSHPKEF